MCRRSAPDSVHSCTRRSSRSPLPTSPPPPSTVPSAPALTIGVCPRGTALLLQHPCSNGVGPESLGGPVLRLDFLGFGGRVGVAGVKHGLQDAPPGIDEPAQGWMEPGKSPPGGGSMCAQVRVSVCAESAKPLPDSQKLVLVRNRPGSGLRCGSTAVISPGHRGARDVTRGLGDHKPAWDECVRRVRNLCSRPVRTEQRKEEPPSQRH